MTPLHSTLGTLHYPHFAPPTTHAYLATIIRDTHLPIYRENPAVVKNETVSNYLRLLQLPSRNGVRTIHSFGTGVMVG